MTDREARAAQRLGLTLLDHNEEGKRRVSRPTVFFMFHCPDSLYNNLLWANCSIDDDVAEQLSSLTVTGEGREALPPVKDVIIVGNSFLAIVEKRRRMSASSTSGRERRWKTDDRPTACPVHSQVPGGSSEESVCCMRGCECVCLVKELRLVMEEELNGALDQSEDEVRLAMYGTALHTFGWPSGVDEGERSRIRSWLRHPMIEPSCDTDDAEIIPNVKDYSVVK